MLESCGVSLGLEYVDIEDGDGDGDKERMIMAGEEVGIIPPVSSG